MLSDQSTSVARTLQLTQEALMLLGSTTALRAQAINVNGKQLGQGLLVDPVYSGKAFAGLLDDLRQKRYPRGDTTLFIMTGGTPGL